LLWERINQIFGHEMKPAKAGRWGLKHKSAQDKATELLQDAMINSSDGLCNLVDNLNTSWQAQNGPVSRGRAENYRYPVSPVLGIQELATCLQNTAWSQICVLDIPLTKYIHICTVQQSQLDSTSKELLCDYYEGLAY
jgi:hypothetical protein